MSSLAMQQKPMKIGGTYIPYVRPKYQTYGTNAPPFEDSEDLPLI